MKRLLLIGAGHAHVHVLMRLARERPRAAEVTLVSPYARQVYSGMLPGWMAGHYTLEQCVIPLAPLAAAAGAARVQASVTALDVARRVAQTDEGEPLGYDIVSIDTGPVQDFDAMPGGHAHGIALRPIEGFITLWQRLHAQWAADALADEEASALTVVGGGAGGIELALAAAWRAQVARWALKVQLVAGRRGLLAGAAPELRERMRHWLTTRGVRVVDDDAARVEPDRVLLAGGGALLSRATLLATGTAAAAWPRAAGLAVDGRGFIGINDRLQSLSHPEVFAAGDCATMIDHPRPKSGVYAVRAGPPLAENLLRALRGAPLVSHVPQSRALYLLATGPKHAVASWGGWSTSGAWVWRWKDHIDRAFMARTTRPGPPARAD
jgi:pyridine nucleotide-disulfide oxidoreductase family protein